jgi:hypothetical protein
MSFPSEVLNMHIINELLIIKLSGTYSVVCKMTVDLIVTNFNTQLANRTSEGFYHFATLWTSECMIQ